MLFINASYKIEPTESEERDLSENSRKLMRNESKNLYLACEKILHAAKYYA